MIFLFLYLAIGAMMAFLGKIGLNPLESFIVLFFWPLLVLYFLFVR